MLSERIWFYLHQYWLDIGDRRVSKWPIISGGLWKIAAIMSVYLIVTHIILKNFMKNRAAYQLTNIILIYNSFMVVINAALFYFTLVSIDSGRIFLNFDYPSVHDRSAQTIWFLNIVWLFMLSRLLDLADTAFFVLRKKNSQLTFLHIYHHSIVPILCWMSLKYNAAIPIIRLFMLFNTAIHTAMYSYYSLAALGPKVRPYLWWKRYLTQFQIIQFSVCGAYGLALYCLQSNYPMEWFWLMVGQNPLFLYLFYDFYAKSYRKKEERRKSLTSGSKYDSTAKGEYAKYL